MLYWCVLYAKLLTRKWVATNNVLAKYKAFCHLIDLGACLLYGNVLKLRYTFAHLTRYYKDAGLVNHLEWHKCEVHVALYIYI